MLLTRFLSDDGVAEVSDFMPVEDAGVAHNLVRRAKTVRGEVRFGMRCDPRFDYARATHTASSSAATTEVLFVGRSGARELALRLRSSVPLQLADGSRGGRVHARRRRIGVVRPRGGARTTSRRPARSPDYARDAFKDTVNFWRAWIGRSTYKGRWREMVNRSALVLKLLTSSEHGSIVAAPTFGLPENIGGVRNWDYRYTWIRDASFTLYGLMRLGYTDEAAAFMRWIDGALPGAERQTARCRSCTRIDGRPALPEETLHHLEGYMGSRRSASATAPTPTSSSTSTAS